MECYANQLHTPNDMPGLGTSLSVALQVLELTAGALDLHQPRIPSRGSGPMVLYVGDAMEHQGESAATLRV